MEGLAHIDTAARGGALALLALWSSLLIRDHWRDLPARVAVAMNGNIACYLVATAGWATSPSLLGLLLAMGAAATPGLFWLFAKAWFNDETRLRMRDMALVVFSVANALLLQMTFAEKPPVFYVSGTIFRIGMLGFAAAGLWEAWRGREGDLVEGRRRLRLRMIGAVGATVVLIAIIEVAVQQAGAPHWLNTLVGIGIVFLVFGFCSAMFATRQTDLFGTPVRATDPAPSPVRDDDPLAARLLAHMTSAMPHRDETLTIAKLAAQLGDPEYRLRRIVNGALGHRNFAAFLNGYRLAEVKAALADHDQREVPILTIALDAGFGSLGPFNRAFRETEGMTPSAWRAERLG